MSIKIYKDGKWQLFPGTGVGGSTNSYTKEESDNKYALKSDVTAVSGKVDNLVTAVSGKVDTGSYLFTLNGGQVNQGDSVNVTGSGASVIVDSAIDSNSENPVQNKVIYGAIQSLTNEVTTAFTLVNEKVTDLEGFRDNQYNKTIVSGTTQIKWKDVSSTSPLYLKTINGVSIIGNSENDNITISGGSDIKYIYTLTADVTTQPSTPDNSWEYDNPQLPWHDNPQSVSETDKVCWVSVRKKSGNSDTWGDWSTPAVWSKWSDRFYSALVEVYKRSNSPIEPTNKPGIFTWDFDKSNFAEGVSSNLNDYKLSIEGSGKYLYKCSAYLTSNSNITLFNSEVWNGPYLVAQNGENGSGQSAVYLDLTNDSSYLVTDINGKVEKEQVINTTLHMYYGTTEQILTECFIEGHKNDTNVSVNNDTVNKRAKISITYPVNTTISDPKLEYTIQATATIDGSPVTKTIGFIVVISKPAESGKDAVMYNIVPSATVIKLDSNGVDYIPDSLSVTVVKVEGAVSTSLSAEQVTAEGLSLKYKYDNGAESAAPTNWQLSFDKSDLNFIGSITLNLYKGNDLIDTETVPVLRDGKNGDKGDKGDAGSNGYTQQVLQIYQRSNSDTLQTPEQTNYTVGQLTGNTWAAPGEWKKEIPPASSIPCFMSTAFIRFDASATNSTISVTWSAPVKILENGTGSDGRMLYPAGIWNSAAPYTRTDTTTPFVLYQPTNGTPAYYVLIAESSGNIEPGTNADVWKLMESLDVAYANVMMAEMGTIGDATFYNNLMFSKKDASGNPVVGKGDTASFTTINGTTTIKMNHSNKPTMAIDFNSGNAYFANGNIQLDKSGDVVVKNIIYDISETIKQEDIKSGQVGSFTYSFYPIKSINTYIDTGTLQATTGQNFDSFVFTFSNKNYEMCEFMEGVLINSGENQVHIVAGIYNEGIPVEEVKPTKFYYQGHENFAEIVLASHSILKYFYHPLNQESSSYSGELYIQGDNYTSFGSNPSAGILYIGNLSQSL